MHIPLLSIFTLLTELCVTACIFYVISSARRYGQFNKKLAISVLAYEIIFNISYMLHRALERVPENVNAPFKPFEVPLAIFHGTFSLLMFIALVVFFIVATRRYARNENFFARYQKLTNAFLIAWSISILSGISFFLVVYIF